MVTRTKYTLKLSWTPAPVATCYRVYLNGILAGETSGSSILLTQLYARSTYTVMVQAVISTTDASGKKVDYYGISASVRTSTL